MNTEIKPDILHQLIDLVKTSKYEPMSVWNDYYKNWNDEQQCHFDFMLLGVMGLEDREGRAWSEAYKQAAHCYKYLSQKRTEIQESEQELQQFPKLLSEDEAKQTLSFLIKYELISDTVNKEHFLYWFGCINKKPIDLEQIEWTENKQLCREFLTKIYKSHLTIAKIEKLTPICFSKNGKPMNLAKNKQKPHIKSDAISTFLATNIKH